MLRRRAGAVAVVAVLVLGGCTSRPSLPNGLVSRGYITHLPTAVGTTRIPAKLVASEGPPTDPTVLRVCDWPDGCRRPYSFVWLTEELGTYPDEAPLGSSRPMRWILDDVDARSGRVIGTGGSLGPNPGGSSQFDLTEDLSPS